MLFAANLFVYWRSCHFTGKLICSRPASEAFPPSKTSMKDKLLNRLILFTLSLETKAHTCTVYIESQSFHFTNISVDLAELELWLSVYR